MRKIVDTTFYSKRIGKLPKGCSMCVKGYKLVLFVTGICPRRCWYCPLSLKKKNKDVIFVNEWQTESFDDLKRELYLTQAKGVGITGGDPLSRIERTEEYIKFLKKEKGLDFHIHLYTSLDLVDLKKLKILYDAGLDEIRFHVDFDDTSKWDKLILAKKYDWDIGIEIPLVMDKESIIYQICDFFDGRIDFLNLNELEISDLNSDQMTKRGYEIKEDGSSAVNGSYELGVRVLKYCCDKKFNVHFCSSKLKDRVQMQNRFKLRGEMTKTQFDLLTDEGLFIRGTLFLKDFDYNKLKDNSYNKDEILKILYEKKKFLEDEGLEVMIDENKMRIITYYEHVEQFSKLFKDIGFVPAIVEQDPTVEACDVNIHYL